MGFAFLPTVQNPPLILAPEARQPPTLNSVLAAAVDMTAGRLLYSKRAGAVFDRPASTGKMMAALLLAEAKGSNLSQTATVIASDTVPFGTTRMDYSVGDTLTWTDVLHCIFMQSAGDATQLAARIIGNEAAGRSINDPRGYETFVAMMNQRARSLGCSRTMFKQSDGLWMVDTTAAEMAIISGTAFLNGPIASLIKTTNKSVAITGPSARNQTLTNTNSLLGDNNNLGAKYGLYDRTSMVSLWDTPSGNKVAICTLSAFTEPQTYADHRAMIAALPTDFPYLAA